MENPISLFKKRARLAKPKGLRSPLYYVRRTVIGLEADKGLLFKLFIYVILIDTAFIYLSPILYMISNMMKGTADLLDPSVVWVPRTLYLGHLQDAWESLKYVKSFTISLSLTTSVALLQTVSCAVAGYAFARLQFPLKKFWFFCLLLSFVIPIQATVLPSLLAAVSMGWINTYIPILLPAVFGHGLKGALFVIIFRQFFMTQPKELEEAAKMDGANVFRTFYRVMLPLAKPASIVVFLFAFVWTWNDYYLPGMYLMSSDNTPLSMGLSQISEVLTVRQAEEGPSIFDESIKMATSFLVILPPLILYAFTQRWFVEGVERTGLVE
ncbi:carbohydrate ABC transporter permease [Paenibacillus sp. J5C2022]|uniref:carbohydrate ABC transporter permease n=1 Tax=Paenibacillus sp. J5C2022 TaxID=2977129 RepID=UPI003978411A